MNEALLSISITIQILNALKHVFIEYQNYNKLNKSNEDEKEFFAKTLTVNAVGFL